MSSADVIEYGAAPLKLGVSREFSTFAAGLRFEDLPARVVHEARRGMLDWIGCAIAGSQHATIRPLMAGVRALGSLEKVPVIAHGRRLGLLEAALVNGQMGHVLDFDDIWKASSFTQARRSSRLFCRPPIPASLPVAI